MTLDRNHSAHGEGASPHPLERHLGYHVVWTAMRIRRSYVEALAECGLVLNQHAILAVLHDAGPMSQKQLAARTTVDPGDLVGYLDGLQASGRVTRERDARDRRRHLVSITEVGRDVLTRADRNLDEAEAELFGTLSGEDREHLVGLLQRVLDQTAGGSAQDL